MKEVRVKIKNGNDITLDKICPCVDNTVYLDYGHKSKIVFTSDSIQIVSYSDDARIEIELGHISKAHVTYGEHEVSIDIKVKELVFNSKYIKAVYDTGELIELNIEF